MMVVARSVFWWPFKTRRSIALDAETHTCEFATGVIALRHAFVADDSD